MFFPSAWKILVRLSAPIFITLMMLATAIRSYAQALYSPIDINAPQIAEGLLKIPAPFKPVDKGIFLQTVTSQDIKKAFKLMYPDEESTYATIGGLYLPRPRDGSAHNPTNGSIIFIAEKQPYSYTVDVVVHEYGHWVQFELTNDVERGKWGGIWLKEAIAKKHVTRYAGTNSDEGFAESFLYWIKARDKVSPAVNSYFVNLSARLSADEHARENALKSSPPITSTNALTVFTDDDVHIHSNK